uniref:Uncharacterized protein n=1 Tax=Monascus pilosus TaxID=89488 RepID=R9UP10_MONPI|nr:hypothetical protein 2382 [Monascus pilosus]
MPWFEVSPGHFQRPLGPNEKFIKSIGDRAHPLGREHWSVTVQARFKTSDALQEGQKRVPELRKAWKMMRFAHPSIASIANAETLDYYVPSSADLEDWMQQTFFVVEEDTSSQRYIAGLQPSPYLTAHYLVRTSELTLHTAHWRTDGFGAMQLVNAFFEAFAGLDDRDSIDLPWGQEVARLVPSIEEVLDLPEEATPEIKAATAECMATLSLTRGAAGVSYQGDLTTLPAGTHSVQVRLSQSETKAIEEACRARGISMLSAIHASIAATTYAGASAEAKSKPYTSTMRFNLRPYVPAPYSSPAYASALYTGGYMIQVPATHSWTENVREYNSAYRRGLSKGFLRARREYALNVQELLEKNISTDGPPPSEVDISSINDAELLVHPVYHGKLGDVEILDVSIGVETLTRQLYCFVWTFRGQLGFNLVYNEAYYNFTTATVLLDTLKNVLLTELGIRDDRVM